MASLGEVVQRLAAREGVEAVLVLSADGLPIEQPHATLRAEAVAALAATLVSTPRASAWAPGGASCAPRVLEYRRRGSARRSAAGRARGDWLAILAAADADIGALLYDLRQHGRLAALALSLLYEMGRRARRRLGHPLLAAQHSREPETAAAARRLRLDRGGGDRAAGRTGPARAHPRGDRRGAGRPASGALSSFPPTTSWSSPARPPPPRRSSGPPGKRSGAIRRPRCCRCMPTGRSATRPPSAALRIPPSTTARRTTVWSRSAWCPSRPETGYGYIVPGRAARGGARTVARFSEKPDAATALDLMAAGALWNSGLFAWTAERLLRKDGRTLPRSPPRCRRSGG